MGVHASVFLALSAAGRHPHTRPFTHAHTHLSRPLTHSPTACHRHLRPARSGFLVRSRTQTSLTHARLSPATMVRNRMARGRAGHPPRPRPERGPTRLRQAAARRAKIETLKSRNPPHLPAQADARVLQFMLDANRPYGAQVRRERGRERACAWREGGAATPDARFARPAFTRASPTCWPSLASKRRPSRAPWTRWPRRAS